MKKTRFMFIVQSLIYDVSLCN